MNDIVIEGDVMGTPLRVLLVEDSEDDAILLERALRRSGFDPQSLRVDTPEDMQAQLDQGGWDVIVADYSMPRFSGLAALALAQQSGLDLPFLIVSGNIGEEVAVAAMKAGAHDYVMKESLARLGAAVRRELDEAMVRRARRQAEAENTRLYGETRHQASKLEALLEIGNDLSATLDLSNVLQRIACHARHLLEADKSDVYLLDSDGETLRPIVLLGESANDSTAASIKVGQGIIGMVAESGIPEYVNAVFDDPRFGRSAAMPAAEKALMCAPLVSRGRLMGVMALERSTVSGGFSQADLDFLTILARQAAIAIENARMYAAEQQRTEELGRALEQQHELDRLKDEFIQNVSHELRTPVTIIQGYAELLDSGELGPLAPEQSQPISIIARRASALRSLVGDLTIILRAQAREFRHLPVNLGEVINLMMEDFRLAAVQAGLELKADVSSELDPIYGDCDHLRRMLENLVGNAIKFTARGGRVTVRLFQDQERLVLEVADTGVGIAADQLERIFDRFYQVDGSTTRRYGGMGLGLALVKEIVDSHGGEIKVISELDAGSTFRVFFPIGD